MPEEAFVDVRLWDKIYKVQVYPYFYVTFHITLSERDDERLYGHIHKKNGAITLTFTHSARTDVTVDEWNKLNGKFQGKANKIGVEQDVHAWLFTRGLEDHYSKVCEAIFAFTQPMMRSAQ